jgi:hypothetical protein
MVSLQFNGGQRIATFIQSLEGLIHLFWQLTDLRDTY